MKKLTTAEWERKWVGGPIERFDQKNIMFNRWSWEPEMRTQLKNWVFSGEIGENEGYALRDMALRRASRVGTGITMSNMSKPNPSRFAKALTETMKDVRKAAVLPGQTPSMDAADLNPPEGAKDAYASDPESAAQDVKNAAIYFGASLVGICRTDNRWVYSHTYDGEGPSGGPGDAPVVIGDHTPQEIPEEYKYAVVTCFKEDYNMMKYYPSWIAHAATSMGYSMMAITNMFLSAFIRSLGFKAIDCTTNDVALSPPLAMQAGLGELGRHGILITPEYGPRVRITQIFTDLPLAVDAPIEFGVTDFCSACEKCAKLCPSQSIRFGERTIEPNNVSNAGGGLKWPINAETCRQYWGRMNRPCTTCISCCPYNKPDTLFHKTTLKFTDYARWADPFYVKMDDLLGYGKPRKPDNFWREWRPERL